MSEVRETEAGSGGGGRRRPSIAANAAWLMVAELVGKAANFLLIVIIARGFGPREYGHFAFAFAFLPLFLQLARWGIDVASLRRVGAEPALFSRVFVNAGVLRVTLATIATGAGFLAMPLFVDDDHAVAVIAVVGVAVLLDEIGIFLSTGFTAAERLHLHAAVVVFNRVVSTALAAVVVDAGGGLLAVAVAYLAGSLGAVVLGIALFLRRLPPVVARDLDRREIVDLLQQGAPFGIASFLNMAVFRLDSVLLQAMKGPTAVGIYGVAYRFFEPLLFVTWSISHAATPRLVREAAEGDRTGRTFELCLAAILAFYLPIAAGAFFTADWLVEKLFGPRYLDAVDAVAWLAGASVFYAAAHLARSAVIAGGARRSLVVVAAAVLAVNIALNVALIPEHGTTGAAAATLVSELLGCIAMFVIYARSFARLRLHGTTAAPIVATACMVLALLPGVRGGWALLVGPAVYGAALVLATRVFAAGDVRSFLAVVRSGRR